MRRREKELGEKRTGKEKERERGRERERDERERGRERERVRDSVLTSWSVLERFLHISPMATILGLPISVGATVFTLSIMNNM